MEESREMTELFRQLCRLYLGNDCSEGELRTTLTRTLQLVNNPVFCTGPLDEFRLVESIKKRLMKANRQTTAVEFSRCCTNLREKDVPKNRAGILKFLLTLHQHRKQKEDVSPPLPFGSSLSTSSGSKKTSGSVAPDILNKRPLETVGTDAAPSQFVQASKVTRSQVPQSNVGNVRVPHETRSSSSTANGSVQNGVPRPAVIARNAVDPASIPTPDPVLLRDAIFVLQGINGQYLRFDAKTKNYYFVPTAVVGKPKKELFMRIAEIGFLHGQIKSFCERGNNDPTRGYMAQAFRSALQDELSDYYKYLAVLQAQIDQSERGQRIGVSKPNLDGSSNDRAFMTPRRLHVSLSGWKRKFMILLSIIESCHGHRGGSLLSQIYKDIRHGDPDWQQAAIKLLTVACRPMITILLKWIFDGVLDDPHEEFFVAGKAAKMDDAAMWLEKYSLRSDMLPSFFDEDLAQKVILAGKSTHCIRFVLKEDWTSEGLDLRRQYLQEQEATIAFDMHQKARLLDLVDYVEKESSERLITLMSERFLFDDHLAALKKYILLSQGDFARHLMDLVDVELSKPLADVYLHNLSECLEVAVRQTNAQFEPSEVLGRLVVDAFGSSPETEEEDKSKTGWDAFALRYTTEGPISMVISDQCSETYSRLFHFVWRLKRLSFLLASLWHRLMSTTSICRSLGVHLSPVLVHQLQLPACEMSHFIECMQYYFLYEVIECSWHVFQKQLSTNRSNLDSVIKLHDAYLEQLAGKLFLADEYDRLLENLYAVLNVILEFRDLCSGFLDSATGKSKISKGATETGVSKVKTQTQGKPSGRVAPLPSQAKPQAPLTEQESVLLSKLRAIIDKYRRSIRKFLDSLIAQSDDELKSLSLRLDFSGFYFKKEYGNDTPLSYRRLNEKKKYVDNESP